ncbi:MAG: type II secretion system protein [Sulfuricellaceae bacterium]|nr:type II secretion system protein [Sulfuricellaceae bacterium]
MAKGQKACRGFSLLEVLVAFVVLALTLSVLMRIFSGGARNAMLANDYSRAVLIAESKLEAVGIEFPLSAGGASGEVDEKFGWQLSAQLLPDTAPVQGAVANGLYQVEVSVTWDESGKQRAISLSSQRLAQLNPS